MPHRHKFLTRPLFLQVRDEFASRISQGNWRANDCIPNEGALALELGVSQGTIRKALDLMEEEKLVVRRQGRGTFVIDANCEDLASRFSSFFAASDQRVDGTFFVIEGTTGAPNADEIDHLGIHPQEQIRRSIRIRKYASKPFMIEHSTVVLRHWTGLSEDKLDCAKLIELARRSGIFLSHAIEEVEARECPADVAEMLSIEVGAPLLHVSRVVFSDRGSKLQWRRGWLNQDLKYVSVTS